MPAPRWHDDTHLLLLPLLNPHSQLGDRQLLVLVLVHLLHLQKTLKKKHFTKYQPVFPGACEPRQGQVFPPHFRGKVFSFSFDGFPEKRDINPFPPMAFLVASLAATRQSLSVEVKDARGDLLRRKQHRDQHQQHFQDPAQPSLELHLQRLGID